MTEPLYAPPQIETVSVDERGRWTMKRVYSQYTSREVFVDPAGVEWVRVSTDAFNPERGDIAVAVTTRGLRPVLLRRRDALAKNLKEGARMNRLGVVDGTPAYLETRYGLVAAAALEQEAEVLDAAGERGRCLIGGSFSDETGWWAVEEVFDDGSVSLIGPKGDNRWTTIDRPPPLEFLVEPLEAHCNHPGGCYKSPFPF